jgi:mycothiol synthase
MEGIVIGSTSELEGQVSIHRALTQPELASVLDVGRRVSEEDVPSVEELEHTLATEAGSLYLLAYLGEAVGGSGVGRPSSLAGCLYAIARVLPEFRRRGAGGALYSALSAQARRIGRESLLGRIRADDTDSLGFAERRGFREISRECPVALDLSRATVTASEPPPGVEIVSLAERLDLARAAWQVEVETAADIPIEDGLTPWTFDQWRAGTLDSPSALAEGTFVALADCEVVGYAGLTALGSDGRIAEHLLTGVRRQWRGRGIATALKRRQVAWAKAAGYERLATSNDEANAAMRAINAKLGYKPQPIWVMVRGPLEAFPCCD